MKRDMINPTELAKRTKESARTVSLRINERTWLGFEQLAKENDTTANALISELADYYIENLKDDGLNLSDTAVSFNKFKTAVEKEVRKLCRWTIDDSVLDTNMLYAVDNDLTDRNCYTYLGNLKRIFKKICMDRNGKEWINIESDFGTFLCRDTNIYPTLEKKCTYHTSAYDPRQPVQDLVFIPFEKCPDVICLINAVKKIAEKNKIQFEYDIDTIDDIVRCINRHDYDYREEDVDEEKKVPHLYGISYATHGNGESRFLSVNYNTEERRAMITEISHIIIHAAEEACA